MPIFRTVHTADHCADIYIALHIIIQNIPTLQTVGLLVRRLNVCEDDDSELHHQDMSFWRQSRWWPPGHQMRVLERVANVNEARSLAGSPNLRVNSHSHIRRLPCCNRGDGALICATELTL